MPEDQDWARGPTHRGRGPVVAAYTGTGALDRDCPHCRQPAGEYCVHDDGVPRKMPCPQRIPHTDTGGHE